MFAGKKQGKNKVGATQKQGKAKIAFKNQGFPCSVKLFALLLAQNQNACTREPLKLP
jgi:hypothetical protein